MKISVYGNTHYAWVAAAKLAEKGNEVVLCVPPLENFSASFDTSRENLLPELLAEQKKSARLCVQENPHAPSTVHLLADDYTQETFQAAIANIAAHLNADTFVLLLSALPVGVLQKVQADINAAQQAKNSPHQLRLAALPLFIREGTALADFEKPQLFLLGSEDAAVIACVSALMQPFMQQASQVMVVPVAAAELIRFGINAMLATRISFMNEMAALAEKINVDVDIVRQGMAADSRVGGDYLQAGCGFGGPSFAGDLLDFAQTIKEQLDTPGLIDAVLDINEAQREILFRKIWRFFRGDLSGKTVAIWGVAFKSGASSVSHSVAHPLLLALWAQGCRTQVYDPQAMDALKKYYPQQTLLSFANTALDAAQNADAIMLVTAWSEFRAPDFPAVIKKMAQPVFFDGRNLYKPSDMRALGFRYFGIGRGESI